jgi:hypothetical protein
MRAFVLIITLFVSAGLHQGLWAQKIRRSLPGKPVICYYSSENRPDHIGTSDNSKRWRENRIGRVKTASFDVEYINFPADNLAKTAFQYAVEIWESELTSSIPIRIRAEWTNLDPGELGQAIWGSAFANFGGEQHSNTFYPVALAEKISRRQINEPTDPDIVASFNAKTNWYLGTDGNTPSGRMDLVTIVLHEIAHGLGFTDSFDVEGTLGTSGLSSGDQSLPFIFDLFVQAHPDLDLVHDFPSPSTDLANLLQGANVLFNSPLAVAQNGGVKPKLYSPATFNNGSSISHLDEAFFNSPGDADRLMTPQIAFAESIHELGALLPAMLSDMGWVYTNIDHAPLKDTERSDGLPYVVTASIISDNGYDPTTVKLHYTTNGSTFAIVDMTPTGIADQFEASLPGTTNPLAYGYFISVVDAAQRTFSNPGLIEEIGKDPEQGTHFFNIGRDLATPEITHSPLTYVFKGTSAVALTAQVTDNLGVKEVLVEYFVKEGPVETVLMEHVTGTDEYAAVLSLAGLSSGDVIQYRIVARDMAGLENISQLPGEGYFTIRVISIQEAQDFYVNNFNGPSNDFFGDNFTITTLPGFHDGAIHSDHPYNNGIGPANEGHYSYQLLIPIRLDDSNPIIRYDEVVLVEPGEAGSVFGNDNFFDYVVAEGSADGGVTWQVFAPGYDSRAESVWLARYNEEISNDNSLSQGDSTLYRERTINMLENGNFAPGDELLIRFRIFADQFSHGWGWAIDNLNIQVPVTGIEHPLSRDFQIYPVPVKQNLVIELHNAAEVVDIQISDLQGKIMNAQQLYFEGGKMLRKMIDVHLLQDGLYVIKARSKDRIYTRKFLKVHQ